MGICEENTWSVQLKNPHCQKLLPGNDYLRQQTEKI
jgi:hypothetical protein